MDKIQGIIFSNQYKSSNYKEHNKSLIPEKLINRNLVDPAPIFDEEEENMISSSKKTSNCPELPATTMFH